MELNIHFFFLLFLIPSGMATSVADITWTNALNLHVRVNSYLNGTDRMACESISFGLENETVVMGSRPDGEVSLSYCLNTLKDHRKGHGIVIRVPNIDVYNKALPVFQSIANSSEPADWITLNFAIAKGPNGEQPQITTRELNALLDLKVWPNKFRVSVAMTSGYEGSDKGYSLVQIQRMIATVLQVPNLEKHKPVDLSADVYHASHTYSPDSLTFLEKTGYFEFHVTQEKEDEVNFEAFVDFYYKLGPSHCYLNVPPKLQKKILEYQPNESGVSNCYNSGTIVLWGILVVRLGL